MEPRQQLAVALVLKDRQRVAEVIREALLVKGRVTYAAQYLGVSKSYLHRLLQEYPEAKEGLTLPTAGRPRKQ